MTLIPCPCPCPISSPAPCPFGHGHGHGQFTGESFTQGAMPAGQLAVAFTSKTALMKMSSTLSHQYDIV